MTTIEFSSLLTREASTLKMFATHFTHDDDDAKDLVQDTMLKAISYSEKFITGTNLKGNCHSDSNPERLLLFSLPFYSKRDHYVRNDIREFTQNKQSTSPCVIH